MLYYYRIKKKEYRGINLLSYKREIVKVFCKFGIPVAVYKNYYVIADEDMPNNNTLRMIGKELAKTSLGRFTQKYNYKSGTSNQLFVCYNIL